VKLSCLFLPGPRIVEHAKCAESLGYDRVWSADSPALYSDVWVALARVAEHTERVSLGTAVVYHGIYEASGEGVDALPNGKAWREEIEKIPEPVRHLAIHEDHFVRVNDRDRPFLEPALGATTLSGTPEALRERINGLEQAGLTELVYTPMGDDIERELRTMAEVVGI
jgi:alkanesulfonate monooxygenase SsuD/methylene tetrahydromethanopterin reductase-like flavin-dependent oxidoreductase (luciferase family)